MAKCKTKTFSTTIGYDYFHQCTCPFWKDIYKNAQKQKKTLKQKINKNVIKKDSPRLSKTKKLL